MPSFIELLKQFNRKERFFLVGLALGNTDFTLSSDFRHILNQTFNLSVPEQCFCAMDYHIDWLYASLFLSFTPGVELDKVHENTTQSITANQEDIDFVIAYPHENVFRLILLEAKGVTSWSNSQMTSKMTRLNKIFGNPTAPWTNKVVPYFAVVSPNEPRYLEYLEWPQWTLQGERPRWIPMAISYDLIQPSRCDAHGTVSSTGTYWKVVSKKAKPRTNSD